MMRESDSERIDQQLRAMGDGWQLQIDEDAGARWDSYNACWQVKLAGRDDAKAWIFDVVSMDYTLALTVRAIRDGRRNELKLVGPAAEIKKLIKIAEVFAYANAPR